MSQRVEKWWFFIELQILSPVGTFFGFTGHGSCSHVCVKFGAFSKMEAVG